MSVLDLKLRPRVNHIALSIVFALIGIMFAMPTAHASQALGPGGIRETGCHGRVRGYMSVQAKNVPVILDNYGFTPIPKVSILRIATHTRYNMCQHKADKYKAKWFKACYTFVISPLHPQSHRLFTGVKGTMHIYDPVNGNNINKRFRIHDDGTVQNCSKRVDIPKEDELWMHRRNKPKMKVSGYITILVLSDQGYTIGPRGFHPKYDYRVA